jgi:hypothetical protein
LGLWSRSGQPVFDHEKCSLSNRILLLLPQHSQPPDWEGRTNGIEARFNVGLPVQVLRSLFIFNGSFPPRLLNVRFGESGFFVTPKVISGQRKLSTEPAGGSLAACLISTGVEMKKYQNQRQDRVTTSLQFFRYTKLKTSAVKTCWAKKKDRCKLHTDPRTLTTCCKSGF